MKYAILIAIFVLAFSVRLFAVIRYESVIHEFDPYFNYRATLYLVENGLDEFQNWFDETSWYPLGRIVGGTLFPGLMATAAVLFRVLNALHLFINVRDTCVFIAPLFAGFTAVTAYAFGAEMSGPLCGTIASFLMALVPAYMSRSVAGSYDNEAVAIFALLLTYLLWVKAVRLGSMALAALTAVAYLYMAASWGAYVFIINLIPLYTLVQIALGRYSVRLHVAYSTFYILGIVLSMQIPFIGTQPIKTAEHMAALGIFAMLHGIGILRWLQSLLPASDLRRILRLLAFTAISIAVTALIIVQFSGLVAPWTGRFKTFLDPTYAKEHVPIIASISEHQPSTWGSFFFDLHVLAILLPVGIFFAVRRPTDAGLFVLIYGVCAVWFSGVMIRMMLILAPVACLLSALAITETSTALVRGIKRSSWSDNVGRKTIISSSIALSVIAGLVLSFAKHSVWATSEAYSSPSIVLMANGPSGPIIFDDFRESYAWLDHNTAQDAKVMSWWDYGYQLAQMSNRTTIVDNNTWNTTHIATVGRAFALPEDVAIETIRELDVDYVLVVFGGLVGFSSDDINKFLWMVRIAAREFDDVNEQLYYNNRGQYTVDKTVSKTMRESLVYKLCYYRFGETRSDPRLPEGFDRVRNVEIGLKDIELNHLEEVFTSAHWMVRIYRVKPESDY